MCFVNVFVDLMDPVHCFYYCCFWLRDKNDSTKKSSKICRTLHSFNCGGCVAVGRGFKKHCPQSHEVADVLCGISNLILTFLLAFQMTVPGMIEYFVTKQCSTLLKLFQHLV